jgi:tetratricopeptide (TPR) repeat protein
MTSDHRIERAAELYEQAVFGGDADAIPAADRELDRVEADLGLARARIFHARFLATGEASTDELVLLERSARLYREAGNDRGEGEALFWVGAFHQVVGGDHEAAGPALQRSLELASQAGDRLTQSYALRHLGFAEHTSGRLDAAREYLEASTRLRRDIGFTAGVAANLVGLIYIASEEGRRDDALALVDEATEAAKASDAQAILRLIGEAQATL